MNYDVKGNINQIKSSLHNGVKLVAISKFHPAEYIMEAYEEGQRLFGESRCQELLEKYPILPSDIQWHFIGHLQSKKVKQIVPFISMIQSVDSVKLLEEINNRAKMANRKIKVLLEIHVAEEESKSGFSIEELDEYLDSGDWKRLDNIEFCGLMTMATFTDNEDIIRKDFSTALNYFNKIKEQYFSSFPGFKEKSWGMSGDYKIAMEYGATMVRIGTTIFGPRTY